MERSDAAVGVEAFTAIPVDPSPCPSPSRGEGTLLNEP
jgi:hypothetical protein